MTKDELNQLSNKIIGVAIKIHKALGPGFIEKIYEEALAHEFKKEGIKHERQSLVKINYDGIDLGEQKVDFLVENEVILELKSVSEINEIHRAQLISYLKTANKKLGLILNFAKDTLEIKRVVNRL